MNLNNANRRTLQRVHRDSALMGSIESGLWRPTGQAEKERAIEAARRYELAHKRKGRRNGPLGGVGLDVLRALWNVVDFATGRLEPSIRWLMKETGRCRDAVVTALKRLDRCGFVTWRRRLEFTGAAGVRGPQVRQVTNAYALTIPADAAQLVPAPRSRIEARAATPADYRLQLAQLQRVTTAAADRPFRADHFRLGRLPPLSKALEKLNLLLAECESVTPDQSRPRDSLRDAPSGAGAA